MDINDLQVQADKELAALTDETNIVANVRTVVDNQNAKIAKLQVDLNAALAAQVPSPSGPVVSAEAIQKLSDTLNAMQLASTANANAVAAAVVAGTELAAPPATDPVVTDPPVAGDPPAAADPTTTKTSDPAG